MSSTDGRRNETSGKIAELFDKGMTVLEISRVLGISPTAIYRQARRHKLALPSERERMSA